VDINALLSGAKVMDQLTREKGINDNPAALLALSWYIIGEGKGNKDMVLLPYRDRLILFSRYLQQLIMESIGKELDLDGKIVQQGIAVYGNKGSTDQHAYVQQLRDGLDNFFVTFIEVLSERQGQSILVDNDNTSGEYLFGFFKGTQTALKQNNRRSLTITIEDLTPSTVGALIALYERAVGFYASFVNINAYHQPGVEAGKKAAGKVLETKNRITDLLSEVDQALSIEDIISRLNLQGEEVLVYHILRHYAANHSLNVQGSFYDPENLKVSKS
jgi:glucose-6-phosphate isomerase